jgi:hypothetical protein
VRSGEERAVGRAEYRPLGAEFFVSKVGVHTLVDGEHHGRHGYVDVLALAGALSVTLARQEVWAFLLVHNMIATLAARAAALAGIDPDEISFTAVPGLVRAHLQADTCCPHCGRRPDDPRARLLADVIACPRNRAGRKRTSGRTPAERRTRRTEEATYTITITPSNLPQWDKSLES